MISAAQRKQVAELVKKTPQSLRGETHANLFQKDVIVKAAKLSMSKPHLPCMWRRPAHYEDGEVLEHYYRVTL